VPLGSSFSAERVEAVDRLEPGDAIVLYTDGLVERPAVSISDRLDVLVDCVRGKGGAHPSALRDRILAALVDHAQQDDVCVLVLRREHSRERFFRSFPATAPAVARLRRAFATWLDGTDVEAERRRDAVLALAEAAANAAEHAYSFDGQGIIDVEVVLHDGELRLTVRDHGRWREPDGTGGRGRGRTIMAAVARELEIEESDSGTVVRMAIPARAEVPV
jgi:anti-sigma regulatory factor (Ser/Thr protein kinase)